MQQRQDAYLTGSWAVPARNAKTWTRGNGAGPAGFEASLQSMVFGDFALPSVFDRFRHPVKKSGRFLQTTS